ncbi:MAG: DNA polymerase III subunit gamma/tau [Candidatus Saccharicenans sp.]|uniref:DNA polymerase III subunit gamma/tau n=1 Tax=Candidatus Saccharicenans sp. TaxID=2819258 RepID=UPI004048F429
MSPRPEDSSKSSYLVLARKYRPRQFREVVGQEAVVRTIQNAIKENRIGHAYLFSGMRGVGKTTVARILAKALNCEQGPTPEPCNQCFMCTAINEESLLDFIEIDGASNRGIEDVKALRDSIQYEPMHSRYRVIIIDEVHQLSRDAFNALLKTLEEPPTRTVFIFATTEFHKVPRTIASRCQHFVFKRLVQQQIINHLQYIAGQENIVISPYSLKLIAEAADGSLRDAETLLDMVVSFSGTQVQDKETEEVLGVVNRSLFENLAGAILEGRSQDIFPLVDSLVSAGIDLRHFYSGLIEYFRNLLLARISPDPGGLLMLSEEEIKHLQQMAADFQGEELLRYVLMLQEGEAGLRYSSQPRIYLESWLIKLSCLKRLKSLEEALEEISGIKEKNPMPASPRSDYQPVKSETQARPKTSVRSPEMGPARKNQASPVQNGLSVFNQEKADALYFRVFREKPALAPILKMVNRVETDASSIRLIYARDRKHFADLIEQNLAYLNRVAGELSGLAVELKIEEMSPVSGATTNNRPNPTIRETAAEPIKNNSEEARALLQDPKTRSLLDTLKGQVIAIRKKPGPDKN